MNISEAASRSGLSAKTIRYYEDIGLVECPARGDNGYRQYDSRALGELQFLAPAREVGFDLKESKELLGLLRDKSRQSHDVRELVLEKSRRLGQRIEQLQSMQGVLEKMAARCRGDESPECAILDDLVATAEDAA
jgi:Cu(I)-responsive transcriptional regulator